MSFLADLPDPLRVALALGFGLLLVVLRSDAQRFGAAEYDEPDERGRRPSVRRRLAWYATGVLLVLGAATAHPDAAGVLRLGIGERLPAVVLGIVLAAAGIGAALLVAWYRYGTLRLPRPDAYPGAVANAVGTAFVDEAAFRGIVLGLLLAAGAPPLVALGGQALVHVVATRLAVPGRPRYLLVATAVLALAGGLAALATGGIAAGFLGHAVTRFALFATTGHAGMAPRRGEEPEEREAAARPPEGWRVLGGPRR